MQIVCYITTLFPRPCVFLMRFANSGIGNSIFNIEFGSRVILHINGINVRSLINKIASKVHYVDVVEVVTGLALIIFVGDLVGCFHPPTVVYGLLNVVKDLK